MSCGVAVTMEKLALAALLLRCWPEGVTSVLRSGCEAALSSCRPLSTPQKALPFRLWVYEIETPHFKLVKIKIN